MIVEALDRSFVLLSSQNAAGAGCSVLSKLAKAKRRELCAREPLQIARHGNNPKKDLRSPTATALGRIGPPASSAIPVLLPDLSPTNPRFAYSIAGVLVRIDPSADGIDRALRELIRQRRHEHFATKVAEGNIATRSTLEGPFIFFVDKWSAAQILGLLRPEAPRVVPVLIPLLDDKEERMRGIGAESLGRLGPAASDALPKLQLLLNDDWAMVREAATNAIRGIDRRLPQ